MTKPHQERGTEPAAQQSHPPERAAAPEFKASLQGFANAYTTYTRELDGVWATMRQRCLEAYNQLQQESLPDSLTNGALVVHQEDAMRTYIRTLRKNWEESRQQYEGAYQSYLRSLQEAWRGVRTSELSPQDVLAIGHSILAAGQFACLTSGRWDLLPSYGIPPEAINLMRYS